MLYDLIILGAGPAGCAAAVYAGRKKMKTLLITESFGGQSIVSDDIHNWIGETNISGLELAQKMENHVRAYADTIDIKTPEKAESLKKIGGSAEGQNPVFEVKTDANQAYQGKTIILALGARHRKLGVPGEDRLNSKGVFYCSTCDAPLMEGKKTAVIGSGNAAIEAVTDLLPYAEKISLLVRGIELKGDKITQEQIIRNPKVEIIFNTETQEILGEKFVSGLKCKDKTTGEEKNLEVEGIFVQIGAMPNTEMIKGLVEINPKGEIIVNAKHASTSQPGIFAAGDITDDPYKQNNISAGDGVKAALAAHNYLLNQNRNL